MVINIICSYYEPEVARELLASGYVMVGHAKVAVKEMDGQPATFDFDPNRGTTPSLL